MASGLATPLPVEFDVEDLGPATPLPVGFSASEISGLATPLPAEGVF